MANGFNFHTDGARISDPSLGQQGPRTDPEQVYVSVASFSLLLASSSQIDLQSIVHLLSRAIRRETGFLSHISGGRRSLRGRQEWGTATDQVPGHHAHPWSVYNFVPWSTVPRMWSFKIFLKWQLLRYSKDVIQDNIIDVQICVRLKKIAG